MNPAATPMLLTDLAAIYLPWARLRMKTHANATAIAGWWCDRFEGRAADSIRRADIAAAIADLQGSGRKVGTVNHYLVRLSAIYSYAIKILELEIKNPVSGMFLPHPEGRLRFITPQEAERLISATSDVRAAHIRSFLLLALNTGCRCGELTGLRWCDVDLQSRRFTLEGNRTKTGRRRIIPLNQTAIDALQERRRFCDVYCPGAEFVFCTKGGRSMRDLRKAFTHALERAGIKDFRIHDLRHTFASWLVQGNVPITHVRDLLGHSSVKMTERYAHLATDSLARAVEVIDRNRLSAVPA